MSDIGNFNADFLCFAAAFLWEQNFWNLKETEMLQKNFYLTNNKSTNFNDSGLNYHLISSTIVEFC